MEKNNSTRWILKNRQIMLEMPDRQLLTVSAYEVAGAEFKNRLLINGQIITRRPSEELRDINFHRFPLNVRIRLIRPSENMPALCRLEAYDADNSFELDDTCADQIVVDRSWFPIANEDIKIVEDSLSKAGIKKLGTISLRQYLDLVSQGIGQIVIDEVRISDTFQNLARLEFHKSTLFRGQLYPYQETGVRWLRSVLSEGLGCILGDEMGLGKTIQIIAVVAGENELTQQPSLIVGPATLIENWRRELVKFAPDLKVMVHLGQERTGFPSRLSANDVVLTSYDTAVRDSALLKMIRWNLVILDEAQAIKNPDTIRAEAVKMLPRRTGIAVTGTPVENRLRDLWSLMDFTCPGLLGDRASFEKRFTDDINDAAALESIVTPLILRRMVAEVAADLPERIDIPQFIELSEKAALEYNNLRQEIIQEYGKSANLVALTKLRMFCTHPFLVSGPIGDDPAAFSTKYERLLEILDEIVIEGHKAIIFTSYTGMTDILTTDLPKRYEIFCDSIDGRTPIGQRQKIVDAFQGTIGAATLILNPKAAGTGLNITAANHVIHYNLEWNPAIEDQATARAYRRGQERPVTVHRLFHPGTVEEVIDERVSRKRQLAETVVVGTPGEDSDMQDIARVLELSPIKRD